MSSEAAQKAYPDTENEAGSLSRSNAPVQREAFDRGAVEALRQAATEFERVHPGPYVSDEYLTLYEIATATRSFLLRMADEWVVGQ